MDPSTPARSEAGVPPATGAAPTGQDGAEQDTGEGTTAQPSRPLEIVCAVAAVAGTAALVLLARGIEVRRETDGVDPRWWPELLGMTGLVLAAILLVIAVVGQVFPRNGIETATPRGRARLVFAVTLTIAFIVLWPLAGFLVSAPFFLCATTYLFGGRGWKALLLYPASLSALVHLLFHTVLKVPL